jgi:hypothetical protein
MMESHCSDPHWCLRLITSAVFLFAAFAVPVHGAVANEDGSFDLYFGPDRSEGVPEPNWVQTTPGKGWFVYLRLYGPEQPYFDQTWKPGDPERAD